MKNKIIIYWKEDGIIRTNNYENVTAIEPKEKVLIIHTMNEDYKHNTATFSNNEIISIQF